MMATVTYRPVLAVVAGALSRLIQETLFPPSPFKLMLKDAAVPFVR